MCKPQFTFYKTLQLIHKILLQKYHLLANCKQKNKRTNHVLPTVAAPLVPAMPPRPRLRLVGPQVFDVVPAVDVSPKSPVVVVVVATLLAVCSKHIMSTATCVFYLTNLFPGVTPV